MISSYDVRAGASDHAGGAPASLRGAGEPSVGRLSGEEHQENILEHVGVDGEGADVYIWARARGTC